MRTHRRLRQMIPAVMGESKYITLPQNLLINAGTLREDFETIGQWSAVNGSVADNVTEFNTGTHSVKLTANIGANAYTQKTISWDLTGPKGFTVWIYLHDALTSYTAFEVRIAEDAPFTKYFRWTLQASNLNAAESSGWIKFDFSAEDALLTGAPTWGTMLRIRFYLTAAAGATPSASFDSFYTGIDALPAIILMHDDSRGAFYTNGWPLLKPYRIPLTVFTITALVGTANYMTWAQLAEMASYKVIIGNHGQNHTDLSTLTEAQQETEIQAGIDDLTAQGYATDALYFAAPNGGWNADTITALTAKGIRTFRNTEQWQYRLKNMPLNSSHKMGAQAISTTAVATVKGWIDKAIAGRHLLPLYSHGIDDTVNNTPLANYTEIVDYIRTKAKSRSIYPITIADYYNLTLGPARVRKVI